MIRSSKLYFNKSNKNKKNEITIFINEYKRIATILINHYWENGLKDGKYNFNIIKENQLNFPSMLKKEHLPNIETELTARSIKCISTQICGIIKAITNKRIKDIKRKE